MLRRLLAQQRIGVGQLLVADLAVAAAGQERRHAGTTAEIADQAGNQDDDRKRHVVEEQGDEGRRRQAAHGVVLERALADPQHRLDHDHQHGGLQAEEQALHDGDLAEQHVDPAERHDGEQAGQHEQRAGEQAAFGLVHQPADIDRELLRLGAGQQRAVVQRLQEALLADPLLLLDDDAVHHRDLAGRTAEGECGDARPDLHRLAERHAVILHLSLRLPAKDR